MEKLFQSLHLLRILYTMHEGIGKISKGNHILRIDAKAWPTNECKVFMLKFIDHVIQGKPTANVLQRNMKQIGMGHQ